MIGKGHTAMIGPKFSSSTSSLSKEIQAKIQSTINQLQEDPTIPGLHVEKIGNDNLHTARINDNYRIVFAEYGESNLFVLLFVGTHDEAYRYAEKYKLEINPMTGGFQEVEKAPKKIAINTTTKKQLSRLSGIQDIQFISMGVPEEYWPQLREKVFTVAQLSGFKGLIPEETYDTFEFILDGAPIDEAMELFEAMKTPVDPVAVSDKQPLFGGYSPEDLISVGVPYDNIDKVRRIKTDKELEIIAAELPILARQSLYALKAGETIEDVKKTTFSTAKENKTNNYMAAANSPITLAEFAPIVSDEALKAILDYPNEKWRVFLHPTQSEIINQDYNGPARIVGGAGTGKTVVIVHRAKRMASECNNSEKVLVTTFGKTLKHDIDERIKSICSSDELSHIEVVTVDKLTSSLSQSNLHKRVIYDAGSGLKLSDIWNTVLKKTAMSDDFDCDFCIKEWQDVIQSQKITALEDYLSAQRHGRGKQLDRSNRDKFWRLCEKYKTECDRLSVIDIDYAQNILVEIIANDKNKQYKSVIVDECQDLRSPALRMLRALAGEQRKNDLYLSGDSRQRIYGGHVSLSQCGIAINNRSRILKLNYRTTYEIYEFATQLQKDYQYDDLDGRSMSKDKSTCIFHGAPPLIMKFKNPEIETQEMIRDIRKMIDSSVHPTDICIMVRSNALLKNISKLLPENGLRVLEVTNQQPDDKEIPGVRIMTMHRGKGMEFSCVYLPYLRDDIIPSKHDLEKATDDEARNEIMLSEANLLSVAITRAKHRVWLSYSGTPSIIISKYV